MTEPTPPRSVLASVLRRAADLLLLLAGVAIGVALGVTLPVVVLGGASTLLTVLLGSAAALTLTIVLLLVLRRWVIPSVGASSRKLVEPMLGRFLDVVAPSAGSESRRIVAGAADILKAWSAARALWRTLAVLGGLIVASVGTAQLVVFIQQTDLLRSQTARLSEQNSLIQLQARLAALARQADLQQDEAQRRYDEITNILSESQSPAAQEFALLLLPEAMVMPVELVDPTWKPTPPLTPENCEPELTVVYPNLHRLAERLLMFARQDRITEVDVDGLPRPSGQVSTAICRALHRLGYNNAENPVFGDCIWDAVFDKNGRPHDNDVSASRMRELERKGRLKPHDDPSPASHVSQRYDLRHVRRGQLAGAALQRADLYLANLEGAQLWKTNLQDAILAEAHLQRAELRGACLQGADLHGAQLQGAALNHAQLQGALLKDAQLQDSRLWRANLLGANLRYAQLHGAVLREAQLQAADLSEAQLQGVDLRRAQMQGACLHAAQLQGADLSETRLEAARLVEATLSGATLLLQATSAGPVAYWERVDDPNVDTTAEPVVVPPAILTQTALGRTYVLRPSSSEDKARVRRAFADGSLTAACWETEEQAQKAMRTALGEDAVGWITKRATMFTPVKLDGVLIDADTLAALAPNASYPPPAEVFKTAVTDPRQIEEREYAPYHLPDPKEALLRRTASQPVLSTAPAADHDP